VVLQATTTPCLHLKPLDLRPRSWMFDFVHAQEDFLFWIPVYPTRPQWRHLFASLQHGIVSAITPTRRSGARDTWVPMGPYRPGSWRSLKWIRPVRSPIDMQVGSETLSTSPTSLEDLGRPHPDHGRPPGIVAQASPLGCVTAPPVGPRVAGSAL
jgi:hypothetical protein